MPKLSKSLRLLQATYRLAVSFWIGGAALFTFLLTPTLFRTLDRDQAGMIVGLLFPGYFLWGMACGLLALTCLLILRQRPIMASKALLLGSMLLLTTLQALVIEPKAASLKQQIPSFTTTPAEAPLRQQFRRLHAISATANLAVIGGGIFLLILL